jgi:uncharacterized membrane protein
MNILNRKRLHNSNNNNFTKNNIMAVIAILNLKSSTSGSGPKNRLAYFSKIASIAISCMLVVLIRLYRSDGSITRQQEATADDPEDRSTKPCL